MSASRAQRLFAASPQLLAAVLVAKLWISGTIRYYVNDRTLWTVLVGGLLFAALCAAAVRAALRAEGGERPSWKTLVYLLPLVVGLLVPARPLSAASGQSSSLGALQLASHVSAADPGDQFGYWVGELAKHPDPTWWAGRTVTLVGFASHQAGLPPHSFIIGRYIVTCCVVDATLLGFPVQVLSGQIPNEGAWVQVTGTFGQHYWTDHTGSQYPLIQQARLTPATIPSSPYLSP